MIFEETEYGCIIHVPHGQMMNPDTVGFIMTLLHGRDVYQRHANADMDDDHSDGERYRSRYMDVVILESSHRYKAVY